MARTPDVDASGRRIPTRLVLRRCRAAAASDRVRGSARSARARAVGRRPAVSRGRRARHHRDHTSDTVSPSKTAAAGQHLDEDDAEGPDVSAPIDRLAARLLGCHVGSRPEDDAHRRHAPATSSSATRAGRRLTRGRWICGLGETEVEDLHRPVGADLDVRGLQVAVDDAVPRAPLRARQRSAPRSAVPRRAAAGPGAMRADRSSPSTSSITSAGR